MKKKLLTITFILGLTLTTHHLSADNNTKWQRIAYIWEGLNTQGLPPAKQQHAQELLDQLIQEVTLAWNEKNPDKVVMIKCIQAPCINPNFPASLKALINASTALQDKTKGRTVAAQLLKDEMKKHEERVQQRKKEREANRLTKGKNAKEKSKKSKKKSEKKKKNNEGETKRRNDVKRYVGAAGVFYILPNEKTIPEKEWLQIPQANQQKMIEEAKKTPYKVLQGAGGTYYELSNGRHILEEEWLKMSPAGQKKLVDEAKKTPYKVRQGQGGTYYEFPNGKLILESEWLEKNKK